MKDRALFELARITPRRAVTLAAGRVCSIPVPGPLRTPLYRACLRAAGADPSEVELPLGDYPTVDALFTRRLREGVRPWSDAPWCSPADGRLERVQRVSSGSLVQAKGIDYPLAELLGDAASAARLDGALAATIYLSPADYHRVHVPADVVIDHVVHLGGELWPVNAVSVSQVDALFARNERAVALFTTRDGRRGAMVMVAATVVGGIELGCPGVDLSKRHLASERMSYDVHWDAPAGSWFGTFHLGSTVVLVVEGDDLSAAAADGARVRVGEPLFVTA